jgi:hypothetical protein
MSAFILTMLSIKFQALICPTDIVSFFISCDIFSMYLSKGMPWLRIAIMSFILVFVSKRIATTADEDDLLATLELFVFAPTGGMLNAKEGDIVITIPMTFNVIVVTIIIKKKIITNNLDIILNARLSN